MKRLSAACLVAAALVVLGQLVLGAADTAKLKFMLAVYADQADVGLKLPEGVACDANGQVVVGDTGNDRLLRFTYRDKVVSGSSVIKIPELLAPARVRLASKGDIYALDARQRRIVHLGRGGDFKGALAFEGAPAATSVLPKAFALDSADNLYVLDVFSARVLVLDATGAFQKAVALPEDVGFASDLTVDAAGTVLLLDSINRRIYSAAKDAAAFTPVGGDLKQYLVTLPTSITASKGITFVAEGTGSSIVSFGRDGSFLARQITMGWEEGTLNHPSQICIDDADDMFVADRDNSRIQVFHLTR